MRWSLLYSLVTGSSSPNIYTEDYRAMEFPTYKKQDCGIHSSKLVSFSHNREMIMCNSWSDSVAYAMAYVISFGLAPDPEEVVSMTILGSDSLYFSNLCSCYSSEKLVSCLFLDSVP